MPLVPRSARPRTSRRWLVAAVALGAFLVPTQIAAAGAGEDPSSTTTTRPADGTWQPAPSTTTTRPADGTWQPAPSTTTTRPAAAPAPSSDAPVPAKPTFTG